LAKNLGDNFNLKREGETWTKSNTLLCFLLPAFY